MSKKSKKTSKKSKASNASKASKATKVSFKERLISVPKTFVAYKRDCIAAIDEAKKERQLLAPLIFTVLLFCSCVFLIGAHFRGVDYFIDNRDSVLKDLDLLRNVSIFSVKSSLLMGFILFAALFLIYVLTRFVCVMIFSRGAKGKTVLLESVIEFGMNAIPLIVFFLIGGVLSNLVWWTFYPLISFFALFFILMLIRSIFDAVERKNQKSLLIFVMTLCIFIALLLINAFMIAVLGFSLLSVVQGVYENLTAILDSALAWIDSVFGDLFHA